MLNVYKRSILLWRFITKNFNFILKDFDSLFHFSKILGSVLNLAHILISCIFHFFIECYEGVQAKLGFLLLLCEIKNKQFFDLQFLFCLSSLSHRLRSCPCHFFSDCREKFDLFLPLVFFFLKLFHLLFMLFNVTWQLQYLGLHVFVLKGFLNKLAKEDFLLFF
jgi:hypothetical protein